MQTDMLLPAGHMCMRRRLGLIDIGLQWLLLRRLFNSAVRRCRRREETIQLGQGGRLDGRLLLLNGRLLLLDSRRSNDRRLLDRVAVCYGSRHDVRWGRRFSLRKRHGGRKLLLGRCDNIRHRYITVLRSTIN